MMEDNVPGFPGYHVTRIGRSRIYIGKRLKVSRKTIYNSLHRG